MSGSSKHKKNTKKKTQGSAKAPNVFALLNQLFGLLDDAKLAPHTILNDAKHKEHYETLAMFAFRKLQAVKYHAARVDTLYEERRAEAKRFHRKAKTPKGPKITSASASYRRSAEEFVYELSAFLSGVRSALDFLARLCVQHTKSMKQIDSISSFLTMAEEGRTGKTVDVVRKHAKWLRHLRDYRDYLVHRLTITAQIGAGRVWKYGKWKTHELPVVVPAENPKFAPDTRMRRAMEEDPPGLSVATTEMSSTGPDGELIEGDHSLEYLPAQGYERIEVLIKREVECLEAFCTDVLLTLIAANFAPIPIGPKIKPAPTAKKGSSS